MESPMSVNRLTVASQISPSELSQMAPVSEFVTVSGKNLANNDGAGVLILIFHHIQ
jgi:hypothetical protein